MTLGFVKFAETARTARSHCLGIAADLGVAVLPLVGLLRVELDLELFVALPAEATYTPNEGRCDRPRLVCNYGASLLLAGISLLGAQPPFGYLLLSPPLRVLGADRWGASDGPLIAAFRFTHPSVRSSAPLLLGSTRCAWCNADILPERVAASPNSRLCITCQLRQENSKWN